MIDVRRIIARKVILRHKRRATKLGRSSSLTVEQWLSTLLHFKERCAYCQVTYYRILEHFVPLSLGGGTTSTNCIPACQSCNILKRDFEPYLHNMNAIPDKLRTRPFYKNIERVHQYLANLQGSEVTR